MRSGDGLRPGEGVVTRWITSHGHDCPAQQILAGVLRGKYLKESSPASFVPSHIVTCPAVAGESEGALRLGLGQVERRVCTALALQACRGTSKWRTPPERRIMLM